MTARKATFGEELRVAIKDAIEERGEDGRQQLLKKLNRGNTKLLTRSGLSHFLSGRKWISEKVLNAIASELGITIIRKGK